MRTFFNFLVPLALFASLASEVAAVNMIMRIATPVAHGLAGISDEMDTLMVQKTDVILLNHGQEELSNVNSQYKDGEGEDDRNVRRRLTKCNLCLKFCPIMP